MQANEFLPVAIYSTDIISRRRMLDLMNGTGEPNIGMAFRLARYFGERLGRHVNVEELFDPDEVPQ